VLGGEAYVDALCSGLAGVDVTGLGGFCLRCCRKAVMLSDVTSLPALLHSGTSTEITCVMHQHDRGSLITMHSNADAAEYTANSLLQRKQVVRVAELYGADAVLRSQIGALLWQTAALEGELVALECRNDLRLCSCHAYGRCQHVQELKTQVILITRSHAQNKAGAALATADAAYR
jgi:hypothetical protein